MIKNTIVCVKWGDKYGREYVERLKEQVEKNCSIPFNFYCLTDNPVEDYDLYLPIVWNNYENGNFWAYRKFYMFKEKSIRRIFFPGERIHQDIHIIDGEHFLYLDLDVIIQHDLKYFFELDMERPYIVKGWWNDIEVCKKNFVNYQSPMINSSVIRWDKGQMEEVYEHVSTNLDILFFTYPTIDNYLNHFFYDIYEEDETQNFFNVFPEGDIYSWYKGNVFPDDMEPKKKREECKICLFNNSGEDNDTEELRSLWNT